ncbi:hypothetical protein PVAP13_9KG030020 [Panicum virgatum]|nr:hypothetical protein PVAP13_9KG030020 [Panicum virgatum]
MAAAAAHALLWRRHRWTALRSLLLVALLHRLHCLAFLAASSPVWLLAAFLLGVVLVHSEPNPNVPPLMLAAAASSADDQDRRHLYKRSRSATGGGGGGGSSSDDSSGGGSSVTSMDMEEDEQHLHLVKEEVVKAAAVAWTADDERSIQSIGSLELERDARLEKLMSRRSSSIIHRNLIDLDIHIPKNVNPPAALGLDDPGPGSAPSALLGQHSSNPFDFHAHHPPETMMRRHESFTAAGAARPSRFRPYFVPAGGGGDAGGSDNSNSSSSPSSSAASSSDQQQAAAAIKVEEAASPPKNGMVVAVDVELISDSSDDDMSLPGDEDDAAGSRLNNDNPRPRPRDEDDDEDDSFEVESITQQVAAGTHLVAACRCKIDANNQKSNTQTDGSDAQASGSSCPVMSTWCQGRKRRTRASASAPAARSGWRPQRWRRRRRWRRARRRGRSGSTTSWALFRSPTTTTPRPRPRQQQQWSQPQRHHRQQQQRRHRQQQRQCRHRHQQQRRRQRHHGHHQQSPAASPRRPPRRLSSASSENNECFSLPLLTSLSLSLYLHKNNQFSKKKGIIQDSYLRLSMQLGYIQRKQSLASHRRQHSSSSSMDDAMQCSAVRCTHHAVFPILKPPSKQIRPAESSTHHSSHPFSFRQARGDLFFHQASKQASNPLPFAHTANATNSTLPSITFQSPCFKLQSAPQLRLRPPRRQETGCAVHTRKPGLPLKPIHAALGPDRNGGLNNPNRRGATLPSSPLSDVVHEFYSSLNEKNSKSLDKLIAPDCIMEDTAYYKPLDVKCTHIYFKRLMESMGKNVKFAIDEVCQGAEHTAAVMWHLEWNGYTIPFTKGCSFYICSENGAVLLIRKVHIFDESPLKPGKWALEILNIVTNLLNMFPKIAEGFLKDPEAIVQPFVKLYKFYVEPFILPFLAYYTYFWTYVARGLTVALHILHNLIKRLI